MAAVASDIQVAKLLFNLRQVNLNAHELIHGASGYPEMLHLLLELGANANALNSRGNGSFVTCHYNVASASALASTPLLIQYGANFSVLDAMGRVPLHALRILF